MKNGIVPRRGDSVFYQSLNSRVAISNGLILMPPLTCSVFSSNNFTFSAFQSKVTSPLLPRHFTTRMASPLPSSPHFTAVTRAVSEQTVTFVSSALPVTIIAPSFHSDASLLTLLLANGVPYVANAQWNNEYLRQHPLLSENTEVAKHIHTRKETAHNGLSLESGA